MQEQEHDKKDLKIQALLEKIGNMTMQHENALADWRVSSTLLSKELEALKGEETTTDDSPAVS